MHVGEACVVMMCACGGGMCCNDVCVWGACVVMMCACGGHVL